MCLSIQQTCNFWTTGLSTKAAKKTDSGKLTTATTSATSSGRSSPVATLKLGNSASTGRDVKSVNVVLMQATPSLGAGDQSSINQLIDFVIDNDVLSYNDIAQFLLSSRHERSVMLMQIRNEVNKSS